MDQEENFQDKAKRHGRNILESLKQPEGMATAALGAFVFNPLVGLVLGVGQGLLARREKATALEIAAQEREMLAGFDAMHQEAMAQVQGMASTDLDREQLAQMGRDYKATRALALSPDPEVRTNAIQKLAELTPRFGEWLEDIEGRNEALFDKNVSTLDEAGVVARQNYERGLAQAQTVQRTGSEMHQLLSDPNFDVNNPVSRARLGQLMDQTPREFLADPADMSDALEKVGANVPGVLGAIVQYYAGKKKAEEFTFTKEDWRKVAHAMLAASAKQAERTRTDAERAALMLDKAAAGINHKPALSYLDRVITGEVQEGEDLEGRPGLYDETARAAAQERAAQASAAEAGNPSKASKLVADVKERASSVLLNTLDPFGTFRAMSGNMEDAEKAPLARFSKRRPTN